LQNLEFAECQLGEWGGVQRLGRSAGRLEASELRAVDDALGLILGL
jgi:hypothetical protein